jgi:hypothetical protein
MEKELYDWKTLLYDPKKDPTCFFSPISISQKWDVSSLAQKWSSQEDADIFAAFNDAIDRAYNWQLTENENSE